MNTKHLLAILLISTLPALRLDGQSTNDGFGALVVNGVDGPAPNRVPLVTPTTLQMAVSGNPNKPFVLLLAPNIHVNEQFFGPGITLDIGPSSGVIVVMNGLDSPVNNFYNLFANTGLSGTANFSFSVPPSLAVGTHFALQAFVVDFAAPNFVAATAATGIEVLAPIGQALIHSKGPGLGQGLLRSVNGGTATVENPGFAFDEFRDIALNDPSELYRNEGSKLSIPQPAEIGPGSIDRFLAPTATQPRFFGGRLQAPFVRTVDGDLYHVRTTSSTTAFMLVDGTTETLVAGSNIASPNGLDPSWKRNVYVRNGVLAAVLDGKGVVNDRLFLFKLDGSTFASTGTGSVEVTPATTVPTVIRAESMASASGVLYFAGDTVAGSGIPNRLYRVPLSGASTGTAITIGSIQNTPVLILQERIGLDLRENAAGDMIFLRAANAADTACRMLRIHTVTATGQSISAIAPFQSLPGIRDFGRASDGTNGRFDISPLGTRIASVRFDAVTGAEDLRVNLISNGAETVVTTGARFNAAIGTILDPKWVDETRILFWAGTSATAMDLYAFDVSTLQLTNLTQTNGQSGSTLPISTAPLATIDPMGQFGDGTNFYFVRGGVASAGAFAGATVRNWVGVELSNLTLFDVTGDEFTGGTTNTTTSLPEDMELYRDAGTNRAWFAAQSTGLSSFLHSIDLGSPTAATIHSQPAALGFPVHRSLQPMNASGGCRAVWHSSDAFVGDAVTETTDFGPVAVVLPNLSDHDILAIRPFPASSGRNGFWYVHANPLGSVSGTLASFDLAIGQPFDVAPPADPLGSVNLLGVSFP